MNLSNHLKAGKRLRRKSQRSWAGRTSVRDDSPRRSLWRSRDKRWFGYTHFLLKGLEKVRCEWSLTTLAYNLKRVLNLVSFEKLMAAVGVKVPQSA
jgi:hypothetical protein